MSQHTQGFVSAFAFAVATLLACEGHVGPLGPMDPGTPTAPGEGSTVPDEKLAHLPPQLLTFEASPQTGVAPHAVTFLWTSTWGASEAHIEGRSCSLDLETDGVADLSFDDCRGKVSAQVVLEVPGTRDVTLSLVDEAGNTATATLQVVTVPPPTVDVHIAQVEFGQSVISESLRLVEGKPALVRAHLISNEVGTPSPSAQLLARLDGMTLGTLQLEGPQTLPTQVTPGSLEQSFTAELPPEWVRPGLRLELAVDPEGVLPETNEENNARVLTPEVGSGTVLYLRAVPVVHQGVTAQLPQGFATALWRLWPLKEIDSQTRAPYTFGGTLSGSNTSAWAALLQELAAVRSSDGNARHYYGFVDVSYNSGVAGIGYLGSPVATGRNDSLTTMVHELGHNFGRSHAPCGTSGDSSYPYANGKIGSWGYVLDEKQLVSPSSHYDLMSYCRPSWISDHNYGRVQDFLEAKPPKSLLQHGEEPLLLVAGSVGADGVQVRPVFPITGARSEVEPGPYTLRVHGPSGVQEISFDVQRMEEHPEGHFTLLVPDPGEVRALEVLQGEQVLWRKVREPRLPARVAPSVQESNGVLEVRWDAAAQPYLRVQHVGEERTTLGLWLRGGVATLPLDGLPEGGEWELSTSDGMCGARGRMQRTPQ